MACGAWGTPGVRWGVCGAAAVLLPLSRKREMPSHCLPPGAYCWAVAPPGGRAPTLTPQRQPGGRRRAPGGEREVRGGQWDQNTLCAAQRAPARCGVRFALKIAPNTALGPRTKPQCHLARCYRRLGSIVGAYIHTDIHSLHTEEPAKTTTKAMDGREAGRVGRASDQQRGRVDGQWAWELAIHIYSRLPSIHIRTQQHGVRFRRLCGALA